MRLVRVKNCKRFVIRVIPMRENIIVSLGHERVALEMHSYDEST